MLDVDVVGGARGERQAAGARQAAAMRAGRRRATHNLPARLRRLRLVRDRAPALAALIFRGGALRAPLRCIQREI